MQFFKFKQSGVCIVITIKEIADMLGISTTTVNNVIHGKTNQVSQKTIEKVQKVIEEFEYVPNMNARNLAQNKSKIIGFAMKAKSDKYEKNALKDTFISELVGAVEKSLRISGYFLMIYISEDLKQIINYVSTWNVDGLILFGMIGDDCILLKSKVSKPMVFIDSYFSEEVMEYINVGLKDLQGGYDITRYLLDCGHRRIGFVADNCLGADKERFLGYKQALREQEIAYRDKDFFLITPGEQELEKCLKDLLEYTKGYTALFCVSDYYAVIIMNYLRDHGKRIPEDISIAGFDDNVYARIVRPSLTTIHQDVSQKGEIAVEKILKLVNGEDIEERIIILPTELIIRQSVKMLKK